jgi:hypothetical protein
LEANVMFRRQWLAAATVPLVLACATGAGGSTAPGNRSVILDSRMERTASGNLDSVYRVFSSNDADARMFFFDLAHILTAKLGDQGVRLRVHVVNTEQAGPHALIERGRGRMPYWTRSSRGTPEKWGT